MTVTPVTTNYPKISPNLFLKADAPGVPADVEISNLGVTPTDGMLCQNSNDGKLYIRSAGSWSAVAGAAGGSGVAAGSGVYAIQQSGSSYIATPGSAYGTLSPITNNTPDLAALILACWNAMTPLSIYGRINILPALNPYTWATQIGPLTGMSLRGGSIAAWVSGSGPPATVIKLGNNLNGYALLYTTGTDNLNHLVTGDGHSFVQHFDMQDLAWEGNSGNQTSGGVWNAYSRNCSFENVEIENTKSDSINFNGLSANFGYFNVARRVSMSNNPAGAGGFITNNCDENEWDHCLFNFIPTYCIKEQSGNSRIAACQFVSSGGTSVGSQTYTVVLSSLGTIITGCNWDTCKSGIHLAGSGTFSGKNIVYGNNLDMSLAAASVTAIYIGAQAATHDGDLIIGNRIRGANQVNTAGTGGAAIILDGSNNMVLSNNTIADYTGEGYTPRMTYGIAEINAGDNNIIQDNNIQGFITGEVSLIGANTLKRFRSFTQPVRATVKAGAPVDGDYPAPVDGLVAVDSTNNKIWVRVGGVWKGVVVA